MILIFSTNQDFSTQTVIDWLHYYGHQPIIINEMNPIVQVNIGLMNEKTDSIEMTLKSGMKIHSKNISIIWYRKGLNFFCWDYKKLLAKKHLKNFYTHLEEESSALQSFIFNFLKPKTIGDYEISDNNKLITLAKANSIGLLTPPTVIITTDKHLDHTKSMVSKNIKDVISVKINNRLFYNRTTKCDMRIKKNLFPSLLQVEIIKKYELRIFYFDGLFYTMAIFSQQNEKTKVDFRDITQKTQLKYIAYKLPRQQEKMMLKLVKELGYTTCSIDMIVDITDKFYFLELNPVGQFGMVSMPCNYHIEKAIALKLITYVNQTYKRA
ncbi:MAG TPA: grasp-with-spasm system ATP-grasp peptide maturase [Ferruginibacter sp.]|nr:grasp-with-spasm system ATP-grasp peptide maturase [Ferruginibacter sp.]